MIVLSRSKGQSIVIGDEITVFVVEVRGDKVRLAIEAPREMPVYRREIYEAIQRFNRQQGFNDGDWPAPTTAETTRVESAPVTSVAMAPLAMPVRDGLCCPACGSDAVAVARIKVAYQGKELVRRRRCDLCGAEFHTVERIELL